MLKISTFCFVIAALFCPILKIFCNKPTILHYLATGSAEASEREKKSLLRNSASNKRWIKPMPVSFLYCLNIWHAVTQDSDAQFLRTPRICVVDNFSFQKLTLRGQFWSLQSPKSVNGAVAPTQKWWQKCSGNVQLIRGSFGKEILLIKFIL